MFLLQRHVIVVFLISFFFQRRLDDSVIYDPQTGRFTFRKRLGQLFRIPRLKRNKKGRPTGVSQLCSMFFTISLYYFGLISFSLNWGPSNYSLDVKSEHLVIRYLPNTPTCNLSYICELNNSTFYRLNVSHFHPYLCTCTC